VARISENADIFLNHGIGAVARLVVSRATSRIGWSAMRLTPRNWPGADCAGSGTKAFILRSIRSAIGPDPHGSNFLFSYAGNGMHVRLREREVTGS